MTLGEFLKIMSANDLLTCDEVKAATVMQNALRPLNLRDFNFMDDRVQKEIAKAFTAHADAVEAHLLAKQLEKGTKQNRTETVEYDDDLEENVKIIQIEREVAHPLAIMALKDRAREKTSESAKIRTKYGI